MRTLLFAPKRRKKAKKSHRRNPSPALLVNPYRAKRRKTSRRRPSTALSLWRPNPMRKGKHRRRRNPDSAAAVAASPQRMGMQIVAGGAGFLAGEGVSKILDGFVKDPASFLHHPVVHAGVKIVGAALLAKKAQKTLGKYAVPAAVGIGASGAKDLWEYFQIRRTQVTALGPGTPAAGALYLEDQGALYLDDDDMEGEEEEYEYIEE